MIDSLATIYTLWSKEEICKFLLEKGIGKGLVWAYCKLRPSPIEKAFKNALKSWDTHHYVKGYYKEHKFESLEDFAQYVQSMRDLHEDNDINVFFTLFEEELRKDKDTYSLLKELREKAIELGVEDIMATVADVKATLDNHTKLLDEINRKLSSINKGIREFTRPEPYMQRYCSYRMNRDEYIRFFIEHRSVESCSLTDYIVGNSENVHNKYLLYGEAQSGKSTELRKLGYDLQKGGLFAPVLFEVSGHTNLMNDLPALDNEDEKRIVLIIDALDERFDGEERNQLCKDIDTYAKEHPRMKIVLSCRSNFHNEYKFEAFRQLSLDDLMEKDVEAYLGGNGMKQQLLEIKRKGLMQIARKPFCLLALVEYYKEKQILPKNIPELYDYFIDRHLKVQEHKSLRRSVAKLRKSKTMLMHIAVAQQLMKKVGLSEEEMLKLADGDMELVDAMLSTSVLKVTEGKGYAFSHNSFKEHLVAKYLIGLGNLDRIQRCCCYVGTNRVMDEWYNTIALMLSNLPEKGNLQKKVVDWIAKDNKELVQYVERGRMTEAQRTSIFVEILESCKRRNSLYNDFYTSKYKELLDFGFSSKAVEYIKRELRTFHERNCHLLNVMFLMHHMPWTQLSETKKKEMRRTLLKAFERLIKIEDTAFPLFVALSNSYLYDKETVSTVYSLMKNSTQPDVVTEFIDYVNDAGLTEDYMDEIIALSPHVHDYRRHGGTCCVRKEHLYEAYKRAQSWETIQKVMRQLAHSVVSHGFYYDSDIRGFNEMTGTLLSRVAEMGNDGLEKSDFVYDILVGMAEEKRDMQKIGADPFTVYFERGGTAEHYFDESLKNLHEKMFNRTEWGKESRDYYKTLESYAYCTSILLTEERVEKIVEEYGANSHEGFYLLTGVKATASDEMKDLIETILENRYSSYWIDPEKPSEWDMREQREYDELMDYERFKKKVQKVIEEKTPQNKDDIKSLRRIKVEFSDGEYERISNYVFGVLHQFYEYNGESIDLVGAMEFISDIKKYKKYVVMKTVERLHNNNKIKTLTDGQQAVYRDAVQEWLVELSGGVFVEDTVYRHPAIQALLYGDVIIDRGTLLKLLPYSCCSIHVKDDKPYSVRSLYLFDYILKQYEEDEIVLRKAVCNCINRDELLVEGNQKLWGRYLVMNQISREYPRVIGWLSKMGNGDATYTIIKALVENVETKAILKKTKTLKQISVEKRQYVYELLASDSSEDDFVRRGLERLMDEEGCNKNLAVRYLIARGSIKGLRYLSCHTELFVHNLSMHYKSISAFPLLTKLYLETIDKKPRHDYSCLMNAIEEIAFCQQARYYNRVRQSLSRLIDKDRKYVDLYWYLDKWETRFLEMNTREMDIEVVKNMLMEA